MKMRARNEALLGSLISVDDHLLEPPMLWQDRVPAQHRDAAPRLVSDWSGDHWLYDGRRVEIAGLAAAAGIPREKVSEDSIRYAEMRPGCYDAQERLVDMDEAGILASMCFPSFTGFCGQIFTQARDRDLALLCVRAFNDWMVDEWCATAPDRFIPLMIMPLWDARESVIEIERCAARGVRAISFPENPTHLGLPSIHDAQEYWYPVLNAAHDADMVICSHIGSSTNMVPCTSADAPGFVAKSWFAGVLPSGSMLDWLFSGWFERLPRLQLVLSEGGIGWIPYFLQNAEYNLDRHRAWCAKRGYRIADSKGVDRRLATDFEHIDVRKLFREHIHGCFLDDVHGIRSIDEIGVENVMIETDYPHSDTTWPRSIEMARRHLAGLREEDAHKILRGNAERVFHFTPATLPLGRSVPALT